MRPIIIKRFLVAQLLTVPCLSFGTFKLPKFFEAPWATNTASSDNKALQPGDTVAVIGASGNVGKLVALRLSDKYNVNGIVRDASSVEQFFEGRNNINLFEADLLNEMMMISKDEATALKYSEALIEPLRTANAVVICTGTTAFPTKAWTKSGAAEGSSDDEDSISSAVLKALVNNSFSIKDAISSLDDQGLNTPNNVDARSNDFIIQAWNQVCKVEQKRIIMLSSIGVQRREKMPFPILNTCGVLNAKAAGEQFVINAAKDRGYSYTIIRPGQLFGGPYDNNYYLGTLFQLDKDAATQDVVFGKGDELLGDTLRSTLAEVTAQICEGDYARDLDFAVVNEKGASPTIEILQERLKMII